MIYERKMKNKFYRKTFREKTLMEGREELHIIIK